GSGSGPTSCRNRTRARPWARRPSPGSPWRTTPRTSATAPPPSPSTAAERGRVGPPGSRFPAGPRRARMAPEVVDVRILVTGGTGQLGSAVVARLRAAGEEVRVLSRRTAPDLVPGDL